MDGPPKGMTRTPGRQVFLNIRVFIGGTTEHGKASDAMDIFDCEGIAFG
jgi:hypothetical protein